MTTIDGAPGHTDLDALEQAARDADREQPASPGMTKDERDAYDLGYRAGKASVVDTAAIAAVREADALREKNDRLRTALTEAMNLLPANWSRDRFRAALSPTEPTVALEKRVATLEHLIVHHHHYVRGPHSGSNDAEF